MVGAGDRWIPEEEYQRICAQVPIVCVDLLPIADVTGLEFGLIRRPTYDGGEGWCLIGGALLRNEPSLEGVRRHLAATLGADIELDASSVRMFDVVEYFTDPAIGEFYDPRKHAVSLTHVGICRGPAEPAGEALEFRWFARDELDTITFGFGQGVLVRRLLAATDQGGGA